MEFTKDDYVMEGKFEVSIAFDNEAFFKGVLRGKIIVKGNWIIIEEGAGAAVYNKDIIRTISVKEI